MFMNQLTNSQFQFYRFYKLPVQQVALYCKLLLYRWITFATWSPYSLIASMHLTSLQHLSQITLDTAQFLTKHVITSKDLQSSYLIFFMGTFFSVSCRTISGASEGSNTSKAVPCFSQRAVRPERWMYVLTSVGQSIWTTQSTSGKSASQQPIFSPLKHKTSFFTKWPASNNNVYEN